MELRSWFDGVQIEEVAYQRLEERPSKPTAMIEPGNRVYAVVGDGWEGFILGGRVSVHEDDGEYLAPSYLIEPILS